MWNTGKSLQLVFDMVIFEMFLACISNIIRKQRIILYSEISARRPAANVNRLGTTTYQRTQWTKVL